MADDVNIQEMYRYNYQQVTPDKLVPGDLVFLSDGSADVTHGGLVISVADDAIRLVNASSYYGQVAEDDWPLVGDKRGQRIVGYGRLLMTIE